MATVSNCFQMRTLTFYTCLYILLYNDKKTVFELALVCGLPFEQQCISSLLHGAMV